MKYRYIQNLGNLLLFMTISSILTVGCSKDNLVGENPYAGGKEPLGVSFKSKYADPESAFPGDLVTFEVKGLKQYEGKFDFFINNTTVGIEDLTDSTVTIKIPEKISSGGATIKIGEQVFFGPTLKIEGSVSIDATFDIINGFNNTVIDILSEGGGYIITGGFTDFEKSATKADPINGLQFLNSNGKASTNMTFGKGVNPFGNVNSMLKMKDGSFIIGGNFVSMNQREAMKIAKLNSKGQLDTMIVEVINSTEDRKNDVDTVSTFNGGIEFGTILKTFVTADNKIIAVGNFDRYSKVDYTYSSRKNYRYVYTPVRNVFRCDANGKLDSTFVYNNKGANGIVTSAIQQNDGKIVLVGQFTSYNDKPAKNIVRLNLDGTVDESFNVGSGADNSISEITYDSAKDKIVLSGVFKNFNGAVANNVVFLNTNGSVDQSFRMREVEGGGVAYAKILSYGKVLVNGSFKKYDGINRSNLLILNMDGSADQRYNHIGSFNGVIYDAVETTSALGLPAVILGGFILSVDGKAVGNIVKLELNPNLN
ncbi:DUF5008 domain-containing protein [Sphingobacterium spiritivorum]|uniref:DUF5008 domain-containing protein n=2 Tax=Sphingobacterium spiritivorum TaxID=258 RepID=UPI003DA44045